MWVAKGASIMPDWLLWAFAIIGMIRVLDFVIAVVIGVVIVVIDEAKDQARRERRKSMGRRW